METYKEQAKLMSACSCGRELMAIKPENKRMPSQLTHKSSDWVQASRSAKHAHTYHPPFPSFNARCKRALSVPNNSIRPTGWDAPLRYAPLMDGVR